MSTNSLRSWRSGRDGNAFGPEVRPYLDESACPKLFGNQCCVFRARNVSHHSPALTNRDIVILRRVVRYSETFKVICAGVGRGSIECQPRSHPEQSYASGLQTNALLQSRF